MDARRIARFLASIALMFAAFSARADYYLVSFTYTFQSTDYFTGPVFGGTAPSTLSGSLRIRADASPIASYVSDYGYRSSDVLGFSASFGNGSWGLTDLQPTWGGPTRHLRRLAGRRSHAGHRRRG